MTGSEYLLGFEGPPSLCESRLTARISRRRLAPDDAAGQARQPYRYTVGRTRLTASLLSQETRRKRKTLQNAAR